MICRTPNSEWTESGRCQSMSVRQK